MLEFKNSNDYSFTVFDEKNNVIYKKLYSDNVFRDCMWLNNSNNFKHWLYVNCYARRSGRFIGRYYRNNFIPQKPR